MFAKILRNKKLALPLALLLLLVLCLVSALALARPDYPYVSWLGVPAVRLGRLPACPDRIDKSVSVYERAGQTFFLSTVTAYGLCPALP